MTLKKNWQCVAAQKRRATFDKIPRDWILPSAALEEAHQRRDITGSFISGFLDGEERRLTDAASMELVEWMSQGRYKATEVTQAFCKRAAIAHQMNNCLHEIFFQKALKRAKYLDGELERTGNPVGPLHGLPVSLKDQFHVKDVETTMGHVGWVGTFEGEANSMKYLNEQSQLVEDLLAQGAVLYCKTSCPQALLLGETVNNLIGVTMNPVNQKLSCGGSSGGECALLALGGSTVGVGSDIGGSVRIPAAFCGVYAIKPSFGRFSYRNVANNVTDKSRDKIAFADHAQNPGQTIVPSAIGFMATALLSLKLIMSSLIQQKPWLRDPDVVEIPWRQALEVIDAREKLCFAVFWNDGVVTPHPPITRGLHLMVEALKASGHNVIEWDPPAHTEAWEIQEAILRADGSADAWKQLRILNEPPVPPLEDTLGDGPSDPMPLLEYQSWSLRRKDYLARYDAYWNSTEACNDTGRPVDGVVLPVAPHAAVIPGKYYHFGYSDFVDLLDYTSVCLPITKVDKDQDQKDPSFVPLTDEDDVNMRAYDPAVYDGAPVGLQLMGRRFDEERLLSVAAIAKDILESHKVSSKQC